MKRLALVIFLVVAAAIGAVVSAPFIAATDLAKNRIAAQIEEWTGRPVTFVGEPTVKLFPYLSLTIEKAQIGNPDRPGDAPFIEMDALTCRLRLWQFLTGRTEVAEFEMIRPRFNLIVDKEGGANWKMRQGAIMSEAAETRVQPAGGSVRAASRHIKEIKLGRFKIVDGTVIYEDTRKGLREELSDVRVNIRWPSIDEAATGTGSFRWRGETVEFNGFAEKPIDLLGGRASDLRIAAASSPLRLSFTGKANALANMQFDGTATISTPSVRRVARWLGTEMENGPILGAARIEGTVNWTGAAVSFPEAKMELDGNAAEGALGFDLAGTRPKIFGTLGFEKLDLTAYAETLQAAANEEGPWPLAPVELPFLDLADLDLRFSADQVLLGNARLAKVAGTARIDVGRLGVTLGQAQIYGAPLTGEMTAEIRNGKITSSAHFEIDAMPAGLALNDLTDSPFLDGQAQIQAKVASSGESWGEFLQSTTGSANIRLTDGAFNRAELNDIAALAGGPDIADRATGSGTTPFSTMTATLSSRDGVIVSEDIHVEGNGFTVDLEAGVSLVTLTLRARGVLTARPLSGLREEKRQIPFVVGGVWTAPLVMPDYERLIQRDVEAPPLAADPPALQIVGPNG